MTGAARVPVIDEDGAAAVSVSGALAGGGGAIFRLSVRSLPIVPVTTALVPPLTTSLLVMPISPFVTVALPVQRSKRRSGVEVRVGSAPPAQVHCRLPLAELLRSEALVPLIARSAERLIVPGPQRSS